MLDDGEEVASEDEERRLLTRRLVLRAPQRGDVGALSAAIDNPRVAMGLVNVPYPYARSDAESWVERERARPFASGASYVAMHGSEDGLIGAGFHSRSDSWPDGFEITFWVAERFWGNGFGTEIAHAIVDDAFTAGCAERLWCAIRVNSAAARRVVEKCGFQFRDTGMVRSLAARGAVPVERFVLERRVWSSLKAWGAEAAAENQNLKSRVLEVDDESDAIGVA